MSDIDFLANKKPADDQEPKNQNKKEKIIWSEPNKDKPLVKETPFSMLSFFGKKKEINQPVAAPKPIVDNNKLKASRREILNLIKRNESSAPKEKQPPGKGLLTRLIEKFKKQLNHKEVLIDYQQAFNQEKIKRSQLANKLSAAKFSAPARLATAPVKPAVRPPLIQKPVKEEILSRSGGRTWAGLNKPAASVRPVVEKKPVTAKRFKDSLWSRFLKMMKVKMAAANRPKLKPAKINLTEILQNIKPEAAKPEPMKPARFVRPANSPEAMVPVKPIREEKIEVKAKVKLPEPAAPEQIQEVAPRVLETNLIKGEIITFFDWHKQAVILVNAILIPVFLIGIIYLGLMYYQKQNQAKIQEQAKRFNELTAEVKQAETGLAEITGFQTRLKTVSQVFAKHIYWTNFFNFLENNTIKDVYYVGFSGNTGGSYLVEAIASSFSNIADQVNVLKNNDKITDVKTVGGEFVPGEAGKKSRAKFSLNFSILKSIFTE